MHLWYPSVMWNRLSIRRIWTLECPPWKKEHGIHCLTWEAWLIWTILDLIVSNAEEDFLAVVQVSRFPCFIRQFRLLLKVGGYFLYTSTLFITLFDMNVDWIYLHYLINFLNLHTINICSTLSCRDLFTGRAHRPFLCIGALKNTTVPRFSCIY